MVRRTVRPHEDSSVSWTRVRAGGGLLALVLVLGTTGYILLGLPWLDALYQTVITVSTVGYREVGAFRCAPPGVLDLSDPRREPASPCIPSEC